LLAGCGRVEEKELALMLPSFSYPLLAVTTILMPLLGGYFSLEPLQLFLQSNPQFLALHVPSRGILK
jgi:hypothetical protein